MYEIPLVRRSDNIEQTQIFAIRFEQSIEYLLPYDQYSKMSDVYESYWTDKFCRRLSDQAQNSDPKTALINDLRANVGGRKNIFRYKIGIINLRATCAPYQNLHL